MADRWRVEREADWMNGTYWIAWRPSEGWKGLAPKFRTHEEALAYADEQARTITITLPRFDGFRHYMEGDWEDVEITYHPDVESALIRTDDGESEGEVIAISRDHFDPVALLLLALARKGDAA